ncbi:MAG: phosphatidate cytidylyltransferase [Actinomycetota bacterium]|nr:phosphatidate cytidylyltransferase [Actinomycetota bacterium]
MQGESDHPHEPGEISGEAASLSDAVPDPADGAESVERPDHRAEGGPAPDPAEGAESGPATRDVGAEGDERPNHRAGGGAARESDEVTQRLSGPPTLSQPSALKAALGPGRDLRRAIVTGVTLAGLVIGLLFLGAKPFFGLAFVVILIAQFEFYRATRAAGHDPAIALGMVAGATMLLGVFTRGEAAAGLVIFLTIVFTIVWYLAHDRHEDFVTDIAITLLGVVYIPLLGSFAGLLATRQDGRGVVIAMIGAAVVYDIFAYAGGSRLGKTPIAPTISPNKTREGAAIATIGTLLVVSLVAPLLGPWHFAQALLFALMVCIVAPLGDLLESMIKRSLDIKDMGAIFPGHGGAFDRIDAILFVAPVAYLSLKVFGL